MLAPAVATLALGTALVVGVGAAHATAVGLVVARTSGASYANVGVVSQGVVPGPSTGKAFGFKVVNNDVQANQYRIVVHPPDRLTTVTLRRGTSTVPLTYVTPPIAAGGSMAFTLKVVLASTAPLGPHAISVSVEDPVTDDGVAAFTAVAEATHQTGTTRNDLFLKTGAQPYIGGPAVQEETGAAVQPSGSVTFSLRLKNDGTTPTAIGVSAQLPLGGLQGWTLVVKDGLSDITQQITTTTYWTPVLAPGATKDLKVVLKRVPQALDETYVRFDSHGPDPSGTVYAHAVPAY
jgi:hypothetical protein